METQWPWWAIAAYAIVGLFVLWYWTTLLFTVVYQYVLYPRRYRRCYDSRYLPCCAVLVPCKGTPLHAKRNLLAFARQDYPEYNVIYAVESECDPIVPLIRETIAESGRGTLVVAGLSSTCAQKVHNLLAALRHVGSAEVIVFADSDIAPQTHWLRQVVLPLSDLKVSIATGFRWFQKRSGTWGEYAHRYTNMVTYALFASMTSWSGMGVWGGTMAMRKVDFDALDVASTWVDSVVDDMSLAQIAVRHRLKTVFVPACITPTDDTLHTFANYAEWFARQLLYMKAYQRNYWAVGVFLAVVMVAVVALIPIAASGAQRTGTSFWAWGGGAGLLLFASEMLAMPVFALLGPVEDWPVFCLLAPVLRLGQGVGFAKTLFTYTIHWSGVRYTFDGDGKVVRVER
jgi:ceramide glucosyltransferase